MTTLRSPAYVACRYGPSDWRCTPQRWWPFIPEGILGIGVGIATVFAPGITALALVTLIAAWAIVTGILEVGAAAGALTLVTIIGAYAPVFGIVLVALGFRVRHAAHALPQGSGGPSGAMRPAI